MTIMPGTIFEPEHEQFRESARRFFQNEIGPHAEAWRKAGCVDVTNSQEETHAL